MPQRSVLIVEDDLSIRLLVRTILQGERFEVDEAPNGAEALARIRRKTYDAVVLDLMIGPGNGVEILRALSDHRPGEKCVVVVSATSQAAIDRIESENIVAKLRKPFDIHELLRAVRQCGEH